MDGGVYADIVCGVDGFDVPVGAAIVGFGEFEVGVSVIIVADEDVVGIDGNDGDGLTDNALGVEGFDVPVGTTVIGFGEFEVVFDVIKVADEDGVGIDGVEGCV